MSDSVISVKNVSKSFKEVHAVKDVSVEIGKGEFVALLGPNGAGKTTLVEMIEGIQKPDKGSILIKGLPWKNNSNKLNRYLGISLQETWFIEKLTLFETLRMFSSFYGLGRDRAEEIMEMVDLGDKRKAYTKNLSGGQRQRLALGIALLNSPEILLLDEPTTGLDPNARREIWQILEKLKAEKETSLILTTHYMEEAQFLCDRIIIIDNGRILAKGTLSDLLERCDAREIIEFSAPLKSMDKVLSIDGVRSHKESRDGSSVRLEVDDITVTLPLLLDYFKSMNIPVGSLECRKSTLDDLFVSMTGRHLSDK